ncbi:hypothetical protein NQ317_012074 [Molorchus minor]|uniref:Uncharacterized protein n=1 Tax=Molorchus minor TaxID=1323400 RepID=A0ABQ9K5I8_9CUCU|nr:hypothetical protein NQ317_012074 [Molorchus minor]
MTFKCVTTWNSSTKLLLVYCIALFICLIQCDSNQKNIKLFKMQRAEQLDVIKKFRKNFQQ